MFVGITYPETDPWSFQNSTHLLHGKKKFTRVINGDVENRECKNAKEVCKIPYSAWFTYTVKNELITYEC